MADSSKLGVYRGCRETASLGVNKWSDARIPEGVIICTDLVNDK